MRERRQHGKPLVITSQASWVDVPLHPAPDKGDLPLLQQRWLSICKGLLAQHGGTPDLIPIEQHIQAPRSRTLVPCMLDVQLVRIADVTVHGVATDSTRRSATVAACDAK
jgi:hypothetical protein